MKGGALCFIYFDKIILNFMWINKQVKPPKEGFLKEE